MWSVALRCPAGLMELGLPTNPNPQNIPHQMSMKRHTKEARIRAIREHEAGRSQAEICRQLNDRVTLNGASCNVARGNRPTTV